MKLKKMRLKSFLFKGYLHAFGLMQNIFGEVRFQHIVADWQCRKLQKSYRHSGTLHEAKSAVIYFADGRTISGGLTDRLIGIVSLYTYCKEHSLPFKIHFTAPFQLSNYLQPNCYDWSIADDEISYDSKQSRPIIIRQTSEGVKNYNYVMDKCSRKYQQLHVYTNAMYKQECFKQMFKELFVPCNTVCRQVDSHLKAMGHKPYIAATFRFQQLLGDFKERGYAILPPP